MRLPEGKNGEAGSAVRRPRLTVAATDDPQASTRSAAQRSCARLRRRRADPKLLRSRPPTECARLGGVRYGRNRRIGRGHPGRDELGHAQGRGGDTCRREAQLVLRRYVRPEVITEEPEIAGQGVTDARVRFRHPDPHPGADRHGPDRRRKPAPGGSHDTPEWPGRLGPQGPGGIGC